MFLTYLVTGGLGFIGSNLTKALVNSGRSVTVIDNKSTGAFQNVSTIMDKINVKVGGVKKIRDLIDDVPDTIFHLGMPSSSPMYRNDPYIMADTIWDALSLFEYAASEEVNQVILASTSSLYSGVFPQVETASIKVTDYYTETRLAIERLAEYYNITHGLKTACLRLFSVYGPNESYKFKYANILTQFIWNLHANQHPLIYGDGTQKRDFTYVEDVVNAFLLADRKVTSKPVLFNVGTGQSTSFNDLVNMLNKAMTKSIDPIREPMPFKNYVEITQADTKRATQLGFTAKVSLEEGIQRTLNAYYPDKYRQP